MPMKDHTLMYRRYNAIAVALMEGVPTPGVTLLLVRNGEEYVSYGADAYTIVPHTKAEHTEAVMAGPSWVIDSITIPLRDIRDLVARLRSVSYVTVVDTDLAAIDTSQEFSYA